MELIRTQTAADCPAHGGNVYRMAQETGIPVEGLIDLSASINPLGVPEMAKKMIREQLDSLVNYPDPDTTELRQKIALHHGIESATVLCGNGSTELIYLLPRALRPASVLIHAPAFSEYERACRLNDKLRITNYELKEKDGFKIIPGEFIEAMRGSDMAFLCNPNNPTGDLLNREDVLWIAEAAGRLKCFLVVDEAFIDFTPEASVVRHVRDNPHLIVLRSMTKFYALTGLRIGYAVIHSSMIEGVREFREPWTVNTLAQIAAAAALDDTGYAEETMKVMAAEKAYLEGRFNEMNIGFLPSSANYYLLDVGNAARVAADLRQKRIMVRDCSNFRGLGSSYIRTAVRSRRENDMLVKELQGSCGE